MKLVGNPCGGSSWVRLPSTAPAGFRAPMGGDRPLPMPPPGSRGVRTKQLRSEQSVPGFVPGRGSPYYLEPSGPSTLVAATAARLEGFAGEFITGCGETYEKTLGVNQHGAPISEPCKGMFGVEIVCGQADADAWLAKLREAQMIVSARISSVRPQLPDFPTDTNAKHTASLAGDWMLKAKQTNTAGVLPFAAGNKVSEITALIRRGACLAQTLDAVLERFRSGGATPRPVGPTPGGTAEGKSWFDDPWMIGAIAAAALALGYVSTR